MLLLTKDQNNKRTWKLAKHILHSNTGKRRFPDWKKATLYGSRPNRTKFFHPPLLSKIPKILTGTSCMAVLHPRLAYAVIYNHPIAKNTLLVNWKFLMQLLLQKPFKLHNTYIDIRRSTN